LPFVCALFVMSFLDRVNLSYAAADMTRDLKFAPYVYGLGAGLFFIGYLLLELPVTRLVAQGSPRFWLALMLVAWGAAATAMGFINSVRTFYACRILLGVAEAGFFPGIIVYLSRWFPGRDRARAIGALAVGLPAANLLGAPLSGLLLAQHWFHIAGWRWLFILEGLPSVLLGFVAYKFLDDSPSIAKWLLPEERVWLKDALANDVADQGAFTKSSASVRVVTVPLVLFALVWFLDNIGVYGFNFWLPLMISKFSGFGSSAVALIAATPFVGALVAAAAVSLSSDRSGERRFHTALPMATFAVGLILSVLCQHEPLLALAMLCVGALGLTSGTPGFWALVTGSQLTSSSLAVALITSAGALGGFCGPYVMGNLRSATGGFAVGVGLLSGAVLIAAVLVFVSVTPLRKFRSLFSSTV
jgi:ACS family tartrate transporter-like MFS transporter